MRETRQSGSEGGGGRKPMRRSYPYQRWDSSWEMVTAAGISGIFRGVLAIKACTAGDGKGMPINFEG
jgi:hypothetical protein